MQTRKRLTREQREEVRSVIRDYLKGGGKNRPKFIAKHLADKGFTHPNGPWTGPRVAQFLYGNPIRVRRSSPVRKLVENQPELRGIEKDEKKSDLIEIAELVLASTLDTEKKEAMLRSLFQGGVRE